MSLPESINLLYVLSGLGVGFLVGMTGVGGGSLMTPLLILLFKVHPQAAVGTDLLYAALTKTVGTLVHGRRQSVEWRVVGRLALGSIPATLLTIAILHWAGSPSAQVTHVISVALGIALLITAPSVLFRQRLQALSGRRAGQLSPAMTGYLTTLLGGMLGVMVTLSSVGAGAIGMAALIFLYPAIELRRLVGSDIAHAVPLTAIAGMGHWWIGDIDMNLLASLLCGSIPGIILGSLCVGIVPDRVQRVILAVILVTVGVKVM
ncbi:sulfite exporter TauE/SafE family protein [Komagataeibacter medellinensis]|nr:sulfite exporter TauE/SafE family protein [Komagataeibacter medellinensis]